MSDLEMAIREGKGKTSTTPQITFQEVGNKIKIGEYIVGIFMDGFYPAEVVKTEIGHVTADFLKPVFFLNKITTT